MSCRAPSRFRESCHRLRGARVVAAAVLLLMLGIPRLAPGADSPPADPVVALREALRRAVESPRDDEHFEALLRLLPTVRLGPSVYYVLEGDLPMSRGQVKDYLARTGSRPAKYGEKPELLLNEDDEGRPTWWDTECSRRLSYSVESEGFTEVERRQVERALRRAAGGWRRLCRRCGVSFEQTPAEPAAGGCRGVHFAVRKTEDPTPYVALAFFPPADKKIDRVLWVFPRFFEDPPLYNRNGTMRHELGHILGYRHEQIRGIAGCAPEDNHWRSLTPYDPRSVMHPPCGEGGSHRMRFTRVDRAGHRQLYRDGRTEGIEGASR